MKKIIIFILLILFSTTIFAKKTKKQENFWKVFVEHPNKENYEKCLKGIKTICTYKKLGYWENNNPTKKKFFRLLKEGNKWAMRLGFVLDRENDFLAAYPIFVAIGNSFKSNPEEYLKLANKVRFVGLGGDIDNSTIKEYKKERKVRIKLLNKIKNKKLMELKYEALDSLSNFSMNEITLNLKEMNKKRIDALIYDKPKEFFIYFNKKEMNFDDISYFLFFYNFFEDNNYQNFHLSYLYYRFNQFFNQFYSKKSKKNRANFIKTVAHIIKLKLISKYSNKNFFVGHNYEDSKSFSFYCNYLNSQIKNVSKEGMDFISKAIFKPGICELVKKHYCTNTVKELDRKYQQCKKSKKTLIQKKIFKEISKEFEYYKKKLKNDPKCYEKNYCSYSQDFIFSNK